jgi:agmatinase
LKFDPDAATAAGSGIYGLPFKPDESRVVVIPVPYEATTSYGGGTSRGPAAVLEASKQVDLFDHETGRPYEAGIAMLDIPRTIVRWNAKAKKLGRKNVKAVNKISESVNRWVYDKTAALLNDGRMPVVLGGDHSVPFGAIRAYAERYPRMGILHLDAHADLRDSYEGFTYSHASIFHNVITRLPISKLVQVGVRDVGTAEIRLIEQSNGRITTFFDDELAARKDAGTAFGELADEIVAGLPHDVYLSWDIDGLDPTLCPGTGTPVPGGLSWNEAIG